MLYRPRLLDMADHSEGYPLDSEQALLVVCSTQATPIPYRTYHSVATMLSPSQLDLCVAKAEVEGGLQNGVHFKSQVCAQGDGVPPSEAREFCDWLAGGSAPKLAGLSFSVCALGDT